MAKLNLVLEKVPLLRCHCARGALWRGVSESCSERAVSERTVSESARSESAMRESAVVY